jgi:hypothetical protein
VATAEQHHRAVQCAGLSTTDASRDRNAALPISAERINIYTGIYYGAGQGEALILRLLFCRINPVKGKSGRLALNR